MNFEKQNFKQNALFAFAIFYLFSSWIVIDSQKLWANQEPAVTEEAIQRHVLGNGLTVIIKPMPQSALATALVIVKTGSATEGEFLGSGISHFVEHMLFKGTQIRRVGAIANEVEALGGDINGFTAQDYTGYLITLPAQKLNEAIEILADALMHSQFDPQELEKEREVILSEIRMDKDDPEQHIRELLFSSAYSRHSYRHPISGYESLLKALSREDLLKYYAQMYIPNNMAIIIAGGMNDEEALAKINKEFGDFTQRPYIMRRLSLEPQQIVKRQVEEAYPTKLTRLLMGFKGVGIGDKGLFALDVLSNLLGEGDDSRLHKEMYKKKRLVYAISSSNFTPMDKGLFMLSATLENDNTGQAIASILEEIEKIKKKGVSFAELEKAKRQVLSGYIFSRQTTSQIAYDIAINEVVATDPEFSRKYVKQVQRLKPQDIQNIAKNYLTEDALTIVTLCPLDTEAKAKKETKKNQPSEIKKIVLENGLTILVNEDHRLPLVAIQAFLKGGVRFETEANNGLSNLTAHMLLLGTKRRCAEALAKEIESIGAGLDAMSGSNSFGVSLNILSQDFEQGIGILADIIVNPAFPEKELSLEKEKVLAQITAQDDDAFQIAFKPLKQALFLNHPYRFDPLGERKSVERIRRDDIAEFYHKLCVANNMVLTIFGDITLEKTLQLVKRNFAQLKPKDLPFLALSESFPQKPSEIIIPTPKEQTLIVLGFSAVKFSDAERYPLEVLNAILSSMSGRLFQRIREDLGGAYALGGASIPGIERGMYYLYVATNQENIDKVKQILRKEILDLQENYVSNNELEKAKEYLCGAKKQSLETNASLGFTSGLDELYGLGFNAYTQYQGKISQVTKEDVMRLAKCYLNFGTAVMIIAMPEAKAPKKR